MSTRLADRSDEQLAQLYARGDDKAFEMLMRRYQNDDKRFFFFRLKNNARADELTQELWRKMFEAIRKGTVFQEDDGFRRFHNTARKRLWIDVWKSVKYQNERKAASTDEPKQGHESTPLVETLASDSPMAQGDVVVEAKQRRSRVLLAMDELNENQREIIMLRHFDGLKFKEVADALQIPENTAKSRLRYAEEALARILRANENNGEGNDS